MNDQLEEIIKYFGKEKQIIKCVEELSELQKELCKSVNGKGNLDNIIEEIADVEIMLKQLKIILKIGARDVLKEKNKKIKRTLNYINEKSKESI